MNSTLAFLGAVIVFVILWVTISQTRRRERDEAWGQFASEIRAEFVDGGFFRSSKVQARAKEWTVILDTYSVSSGGDSRETCTRMRTSLRNQDGFQFTGFRTGLISKLDKTLGAQRIDIGDPEFDRDFVVQGNNESKVLALFANQRICQLIQAQRSMRTGVRKNELSIIATV